MEAEILHQLELIRVYVFIIMVALVIWVTLKSLESFIRIFSGFKKASDNFFENKVSKLLDTGNYEEAIKECKEKLEKQPNNVDAVWYIAKAYFYTGENQLSQEFFEKAIYLVPSWEESANGYIEKIKNR